MKTSEEKYTAWLDGLMKPDEARNFEKEHGALEIEKGEFLKLKNLLKQFYSAHALENPEFFNSQVLLKIQEAAPVRSRGKTWLGIPGLAWSGLIVLAVGFSCFFALIPHNSGSDPRTGYVAEVLKTRTADPKIKATVDNRKNMTIIQLEGLDKLPADQDLSH